MDPDPGSGRWGGGTTYIPYIYLSLSLSLLWCLSLRSSKPKGGQRAQSLAHFYDSGPRDMATSDFRRAQRLLLEARRLGMRVWQTHREGEREILWRWECVRALQHGGDDVAGWDWGVSEIDRLGVGGTRLPFFLAQHGNVMVNAVNGDDDGPNSPRCSKWTFSIIPTFNFYPSMIHPIF